MRVFDEVACPLVYVCGWLFYKILPKKKQCYVNGLSNLNTLFSLTEVGLF